MRKQVNLFLLMTGKPIGGAATFVSHLYRALTAAGYKPVLFRVSKNTHVAPFPFADKIYETRVSARDAVAIAKSAPSIVCYCFWKQMGEQCAELIKAGALHTIHATHELNADCADLHRKLGRPIVTVRESLKYRLTAMGAKAVLIRHPYVPRVKESGERPIHAVSMARVTFCKHQEMVAGANALLPEGKKVQIYGRVDRMFAYHTLDKDYPRWRECYRGEFPNGLAIRALTKAKFSVDMTALKNDGGGSQYTFLESWDAGSVLVVNKKWLLTGHDMAEGWNCVAVESAAQLASVLQTDTREYLRVVEGGRETMLKKHAPADIVSQYMELLDAA